MFFRHCFWLFFFYNSCCFYTKLIDFPPPLKIQWAPTWDPKSTKCSLKFDKLLVFHAFFFAILETLKREETPSGLDLRFVYVFRCLYSNFSSTGVKKYMIFLVFVLAPNTTERIGPSKSSGRQNGKQNRLSGAKMAPLYILICAPLCADKTEC